MNYIKFKKKFIQFNKLTLAVACEEFEYSEVGI